MNQHDHSSMLQGGDGKSHEQSGSGNTYTCPMHPEVVSDKPGNCPKCGMTLVKKEEAKNKMPASDMGGKNMKGHDVGAMQTMSGEGKEQYTCPMHPEVVSDKPGHCPKCGMTLVKKEGSQEASGHDMSQMDGKLKPEQREMVLNHYNTLYWTHATNILLGFFLIASPFTFGYRSMAMCCSDVVSGLLLITFSLLSANPFRLWAPWASCIVGIWLLFAPLIFWSPDASAYIIDSIVGIFAIGFSILIPEMPGMMKMMMTNAARS